MGASTKKTWQITVSILSLLSLEKKIKKAKGKRQRSYGKPFLKRNDNIKFYLTKTIKIY